MKNCLKYSLLAVAAWVMCSCHTPEEPQYSAADSVGITSLTARFVDGPYASDPSAAFTTYVTDVNQTEIVLEIPYYYPLESNNQVTDISRMRIQAATEAGTVITPALAVLDLTKSHKVSVQMPNGRSKEYTIRGKIAKLSGTDIDAITFIDTYQARYDGIVDNDKRTIMVGTPNDVLTGCTIEGRFSPHAAVTSPEPTTPTDIYSGDKLTVTAHDGSTAEYTITFEIPQKVGYGMRPNSGKKIFIKYFGTDYGTTNPVGMSLRLAVCGNDLLIAHDTEILVVDRFSGQLKETIPAPVGFSIHSLVSDAAGNVLIANKAGNGEHLTIYRFRSLQETPELFIDFENVIPYVLETGDVRVVGDIDGDAVITAMAPTYGAATASPSYVAWQVTGGVVGEPQIGVVTPSGQLWNSFNASTVGVSNDLNDGLYFAGYVGVYNIYHFNPAENGWSIAVDTTGFVTSNDIPGSMSLCEFNGARYLAFLRNAAFTWSFTEFKVYDASDPTTMNSAEVFHMTSDEIKSSTISDNSGNDPFGDILFYPSEDGYKLSVYFVDRNWDVVGSYEFDCIKK